MKRKELELPGGLHCVVLNFQNQHFWLIRDHMCFKKKKEKKQWSVNSHHQKQTCCKENLKAPMCDFLKTYPLTQH